MDAATHFVRRRFDGVVMLIGFGILVLCAIPARNGTVGSFERSVFEAINGLPNGLLPFAQSAQFLGILAVGPIVAVVALRLKRSASRSRRSSSRSESSPPSASSGRSSSANGPE